MTTISEEDLSRLIWFAINKGLVSHGYFAAQAIALTRKHWCKVEPYYQRKIICDAQVALELDKTYPATRRLDNRDEWERFVADLEPPKAEHSIDYRCHKCMGEGLKLWRPVHGGRVNGHGLLCAACLAPGVAVASDGKSDTPRHHSVRTDQLSGWLPACPTDDTFWGYSSVPSADARWWRELPTYRDDAKGGGA